MNASDRVTRLQQVADYRTVRKTLRASGIGSVVFGVIALIGGVLPPVDPILAAVGMVLLATGLWNIFAPKPTGIVLDGLTLLMVGAYNIAAAFIGAAQDGSSSGASLWAKIGIFQVLWGVQAFWRFVQFRHAFDAPPTEAESSELDGMVRSLWKTRVRDASDAIEFVVSGFQARAWKARLADGYAVLVTAGGTEARVASKATFDIEERGKGLLGKSLKATFHIGGRTTKGNISPESFERFREWKTGIVMPRAIAA